MSSIYKSLQSCSLHIIPPGGNRANTIHYVHNNQLVRDGELVLMDAGCEYHGYASDITRTWPVSGMKEMGQRVGMVLMGVVTFPIPSEYLMNRIANLETVPLPII